MALNFPSTPTVGQVYTSGSQSWTWNGTVWASSTGTSGGGESTGGITTGKAIAMAIVFGG
jgi:hypothetical protein